MDVIKIIHKKISNQKMKSKERDKSILEYVQCMYNVHCTIMYIHIIRSQASDWNCCVKRLFVCAQQSTSLIVHIMIRRIPHQ